MQAQELLQRDPKSSEHKRIVVLVTDGEELEGDPVEAARAIGESGSVIHVVQIGGRTPEPIPEVGPDGKIAGWRKDRFGKPLTTALSVEGEKQLAAIAEAGQGKLVRAEKGTTGIDQIAAELKRQMRRELGEKVETVYADVYYFPLVLSIVLLVAEAFVGDVPRRVFVRRSAPTETKASRRVRRALGGGKGQKIQEVPRAVS
jgi:Ca-activated chloride channel family protein